MKIVAEADACRHGEVGELFRRDRLYSSQPGQWRRDREGGHIYIASPTRETTA